MGLVKHYYNLIQLGGSEKNKRTLVAEANRAIEILKRAHAKWAAERNHTPCDSETRVCPNDACNLDMTEMRPGMWLCQGCGSEIRKVTL